MFPGAYSARDPPPETVIRLARDDAALRRPTSRIGGEGLARCAVWTPSGRLVGTLVSRYPVAERDGFGLRANPGVIAYR